MNVWINQITEHYLMLSYLFNLYGFYFGGAEEIRTPDPLRARQVLYQLSYDPFAIITL